MNKIKFSHMYNKILDRHNDVIETATLLLVQNIQLEKMPTEFLIYDTEGKFDLPKKGDYLLLLFQKPGESYVADTNLFTTLRRYTPQKYAYYCGQIGNEFEVVIEDSTLNQDKKGA